MLSGILRLSQVSNLMPCKGGLFSTLHALNSDPTDPGLQADVQTTVTKLNASIDGFKNTTQDLVSGLDSFETETRAGVQNFQDLRQLLYNNMIALTDEVNKGGLSEQDGIADSQLQWLDVSADPRTNGTPTWKKLDLSMSFSTSRALGLHIERWSTKI